MALVPGGACSHAVGPSVSALASESSLPQPSSAAASLTHLYSRAGTSRGDAGTHGRTQHVVVRARRRGEVTRAMLGWWPSAWGGGAKRSSQGRGIPRRQLRVREAEEVVTWLQQVLDHAEGARLRGDRRRGRQTHDVERYDVERDDVR